METENGPFIGDVAIKTSVHRGFSVAMLPEGNPTDRYIRTSKMSQVRDPAAHIAEEPAHADRSKQAQDAPGVSPAKVKNQASAAGGAFAVHNICDADGQTVSKVFFGRSLKGLEQKGRIHE